MSSITSGFPPDSKILSAFFDGVANQFRELLRAAFVRRQEQLGLKNVLLADRLGVAKSTFSDIINHGIDRLNTIVRLMLALEIGELSQLNLPSLFDLTPFGWLAAMQTFDNPNELGIEDVELLREIVLSERWAPARTNGDQSQLAVLACEFSAAVSARLGRTVRSRPIDSLVRLAECWGDAFFHCLDTIPIKIGSKP